MCRSFRRVWLIGGALLMGAFGPWLQAETGSPRAAMPLLNNWLFHQGALAGAESVALDDSKWIPVTLPHTWNIEDGSKGGYYRGDGWYRTRFRIPSAWKGKEIFLEFDGANRTAEVFLNAVRIGTHRGGYARFRFDITDAMSPDEPCLLAVRVNNGTGDNLPPITGDYTFFGGLYRGARLVATDPVHIDLLDHASPGVFLRPERIDSIEAALDLRCEVANDSSSLVNISIRTEISDATGETVQVSTEAASVSALGRCIVIGKIKLPHPHFWNGQADPYLYQARCDLLIGREVRDTVRLPLGLRTFSIDPNEGFNLNGRSLDLHGVNRHQQRAGKGWATSEEDEKEDFALIEEMGCTFVRQCHYQQSQSWNNLADQRGMIMWAELAFTNDALDNRAFFESAKDQLRELIRQNEQHPAILFWGIGNETFVRNKKTIPLDTNDRLLRELAQVAREEDPTRLSTYASNGDATEPRAGIPDVIAFNHYFGWYSDKPEDFAPWLDRQKSARPDLCIGMSEYGAGANIAQHEESDKRPVVNGPWHPEEWQAHLHEVYWQTMKARPWMWCKLVWCMFDFASAGRNEGGNPGMNDKGLVSADRKIRKDAFYWYQANWSNQPVLHIASERFAERRVASTTIKVYSNAKTVSVKLNGRDLGSKQSNNHIFLWENINLAPGANDVEAYGSGLGASVARASWNYIPGTPVK